MILLIAAALLAQPADEAEWNCDDPQYQAEMNMCAGFDFQRADAELNRLWPGLIAGAREADRELDRSYDERPGYEDTLRRAQRAWIAFRDEHCTWQGYEARGGSMETMLYQGCRAALTRERIRQLTQPGLGDPAE
jgi:uncharacterized protein YecT (DUF1311 family)